MANMHQRNVSRAQCLAEPLKSTMLYPARRGSSHDGMQEPNALDDQ